MPAEAEGSASLCLGSTCWAYREHSVHLMHRFLAAVITTQLWPVCAFAPWVAARSLCLCVNFSTERLGRATFGPSGAELDGGFGVKQRAACARAQWHMQNGMPREEHLDKAQKSEERRNSPFHAFNYLS